MNLKIDHSSWPELNALLDQALEQPPAQRLLWVEALQSTSSVLKQKLRDMIMHAASVETCDLLLTLPKVDGISDTEAGELDRAGEILGPYRLLRELGSGGMGSVWLAERTDGLVKRAVALKLPHAAWRQAGVVERMAREREILSALNHPNIATLYDAGVVDGQPYLALEYVDGEPIDEYCRVHSVSLRSMLVLFLQVAKAVAHAHAKLVVHRDLKPSNILVTPDAQARLLDFGIAKLLVDESQAAFHLTENSMRALTLDYASPEQISGERITIASDIYSLGVVLYELLAQARPYQLKRNSRRALEAAILESEPISPSRTASEPTRQRALKGDLDMITLKAMRKSPDDRYATVNALIEDIECYLDGRPVSARPSSAWYRTTRFIKRNKWSTVFATFALVAVVAGSVLSMWQARIAWNEKRRAEEVKTFLVTLLQNSNPYASTNTATTVAALLEQANVEVQQMQHASPELRVEVLSIAGTGLLNFQNTDAAERMLLQAVKEARQHLGDAHPLTIKARVQQLPLLRFRGRTKALRDELQELLPMLRAQPTMFATELVIALKNQAHLELDEGHYEAAIAAATEQLRIAETKLGHAHLETAAAQLMYALTLQSGSDKTKALQVTEAAYLATLKRFAAQANHPRIIEAEFLYGCALGNAGKLDDGVRHVALAVERASTLFGSSSRMVGYYSGDLSRYQLQQGDTVRALVSAERSVTIVAQHSEQDSDRYAVALSIRGQALLASGRAADAEKDFRQALTIFTEKLGPAHSMTTTAEQQLRRAQALAKKI